MRTVGINSVYQATQSYLRRVYVSEQILGMWCIIGNKIIKAKCYQISLEYTNRRNSSVFWTSFDFFKLFSFNNFNFMSR